MLTGGIAIGGFRTFARWKKEKIEEKRIDISIEALALMHESKFIFEHIRGPMSFQSEWDDMPINKGDTEAQRRSRGSFYAVLKRIEGHREFFDRAWKLQVRCAAIFGPKIEEAFLLLQKARREVEVSAEMLMRDPYPTYESEDNLETWEGFREDVWGGVAAAARHPDRGGKKLADFSEAIEKQCRPIVDQGFGKEPRKGAFGKTIDWIGL